MTRSRLLFGLTGSIVLGVIVLGLVGYAVWKPNVMRANYDKIQEGMTVQEVDQLMGDSGSLTPAGSPGEDTFTKIWVVEEEGSMTVRFDRQNRVTEKDFSEPPKKPFLDKVRRGLGL